MILAMLFTLWYNILPEKYNLTSSVFSEILRNERTYERTDYNRNLVWISSLSSRACSSAWALSKTGWEKKSPWQKDNLKWKHENYRVATPLQKVEQGILYFPKYLVFQCLLSCEALCNFSQNNHFLFLRNNKCYLILTWNFVFCNALVQSLHIVLYF